MIFNYLLIYISYNKSCVGLKSYIHVLVTESTMGMPHQKKKVFFDVNKWHCQSV